MCGARVCVCVLCADGNISPTAPAFIYLMAGAEYVRALCCCLIVRSKSMERGNLYVCVSGMCVEGVLLGDLQHTAAVCGEQNRRMNNSKGGAQLMLINNTRSGRHSQLRPNWNAQVRSPITYYFSPSTLNVCGAG